MKEVLVDLYKVTVKAWDFDDNSKLLNGYILADELAEIKPIEDHLRSSTYWMKSCEITKIERLNRLIYDGRNGKGMDLPQATLDTMEHNARHTEP
jgi:hypothetical protein